MVNRLLTILFLIMLTPFAMVSLWSFSHIRSESIATFESNLTRFTHNTAMESVNRQLEEIELVFQILKSRISRKGVEDFIGPERVVLNSIVPSIVNTLTFFDEAIISDNEDNYQFYPLKRIENYKPSEQSWYPGINQQKGIHYSEPYLDSVASDKTERVITVSMNLFDDEFQKYGNIAFELDLDAMSAPLQNIVAPFEGKFLVAAKDGSVVMHANHKEIFHLSIPVRWIENARELEGHFYDEESKKFVFYRSFSDPNWVAITLVDKEMYDHWIEKTPQMLVYIVSICMIIYIVLIFLCRGYIREIVSRLYMEINGINYDEECHDLENVYKNLKKKHCDLKEARRISGEDALTGVSNRRKLDENMAEFIQNNTPFYLAILDLDNFKKTNDTFGHAAGDSVLKFVSKVGADILGSDFKIYRYGGEEFVVLFAGSDVDIYLNLLEVWRKTVYERQWRESDLKASFSCGVAQWQEGEVAEDVLKKADEALYEAKRTGKNKIFKYDQLDIVG